jgi:hypothetical protein
MDLQPCIYLQTQITVGFCHTYAKGSNSDGLDLRVKAVACVCLIIMKNDDSKEKFLFSTLPLIFLFKIVRD